MLNLKLKEKYSLTNKRRFKWNQHSALCLLLLFAGVMVLISHSAEILSSSEASPSDDELSPSDKKKGTSEQKLDREVLRQSTRKAYASHK